MISAGEGGVVATDDETIYERAFMFHDTATPYRRTASSIKPFPGLNYRMNEVSSAIMRVQLRKLDGIVERLRKNKEKIKRGISDISQISFRRIPDPEGEVAICIVFYVESAEKAREFRDALVAENIRTESGGYPGILYDADNPRDGHVFLNWRHILKNSELLKKRYQKSIEIMERAVHIDVSPLLTEDDIEDVIEAVHKIASAVL
jgi:dTDP-4-amino-4,6-dideoxygalactose transaminase